MELLLFIFTIVLAILDTSTWPALFFLLTMLTVVLLNMAGGVFQNSSYAVPANLPMRYTNAVVIGMNFSGVFTAIVSIISLSISADLHIAAIFYFSIALFFLVIVLIIYLFLDKNVRINTYLKAFNFF